jgi:hypothetical protein
MREDLLRNNPSPGIIDPEPDCARTLQNQMPGFDKLVDKHGARPWPVEGIDNKGGRLSVLNLSRIFVDAQGEPSMSLWMWRSGPDGSKMMSRHGSAEMAPAKRRPSRTAPSCICAPSLQ